MAKMILVIFCGVLVGVAVGIGSAYLVDYLWPGGVADPSKSWINYPTLASTRIPNFVVENQDITAGPRGGFIFLGILHGAGYGGLIGVVLATGRAIINSIKENKN